MHGGGDVPAFDTDSDSSNNVEILLSDLSIYGADAGATSAGIRFNDAIRNAGLFNVDIARCKDNVLLDDCWTFICEDCNFRDATRYNVNWGNATAGVFRHCRIDGAGSYNIVISQSTTSLSTVQLVFENSAVQFAQQAGIGLRDVDVAHIIGCYFEGNNKGGEGYADIRIYNSSGNTRGVMYNIDNCYATSTGAGAANSIFVDVERGDLVVKGCYNYNGSGNYATGIKLGGVARFANFGSRIAGTDRIAASSSATLIIDMLDDAGDFRFTTTDGGLFDTLTNAKWKFNSPSNRRNELVLQSGGVDKWFLGRGDSDEAIAGRFYIGLTSGGGTTPPFMVDDVSQKIMLNGKWLWIDSTGKLRVKSTAPTSDTDGTVVGTQT